MSISKEKILSLVSSYDILNHYLKPYHNTSSLQQGQNISNPFLPEKQQTPSFNIFKSSRSNEWRYKDFATGHEGSCFDLVSNLFNISFAESLKKVNEDLFLGLENAKVQSAPASLFDVVPKEFTKEELNYWLQYGINEQTLEKFNVLSLSQYKATNKSGKEYTITSSIQSPVFAYRFSSGYKIYKPFDNQFRFQFLGYKQKEYIFGWEQLPENGDIVFITGGEKDVMTLHAHGYNAITMNSETATIGPDIIFDLESRFEKILILYDNDETGLKFSEKNAKAHGLYNITLPKMPNSGKDISDYFSTIGTIESFNNLLNQVISKPRPDASDIEKTIYSARELLALDNENTKYLLEPILPSSGTAVLAGKPDIGKSQLARQLCIHIALGEETFINQKLKTNHQKAVYVATEDDANACSFLLRKQTSSFNQNPTDNLHFIFADLLTQEELIEHLENHLLAHPADLVVVDSFGDVFKGSDANNNTAMRATVKAFSRIAQKFNCLVLFVHHINKGAYKQAPSQEHIQGSSGLVQKVRTAIVISDGDKNIRYLSVTKGNYCPKELKENSMVLQFSEDTFLFSNTGHTIPTNAINADNSNNPDKIQNLLPIAQEIFEDKEIKHKDAIEKFCKMTNKSIATAKRAIKDMLELEIIEKSEDGKRYRLVDISEEDEEEDPF